MSAQTAAPLPDVYQGFLDRPGLSALIADLRALPGGVAVSVKSSERGYVDETLQFGLEAAFDALAAGQVRAVQLRYMHESTPWTDTVFRAGDGYRLVRMRAPT
jgi:hypothetical protein